MNTPSTSFQTKSMLLTFLLLLLAWSGQAQNEQKGFSFQGYARDFSGAAYSSQSIIAQFSIYPQGESVEYTEQHSLTTDPYGVFYAQVGSITPVNFALIDFSKKKYLMKVEIKVTGGDFVTISDTELLAVPYAKASENAINAQTATSANNGVPPGVVQSFAGPVGQLPAGYLVCDGSSVAVADYPELYNAIGDSWGGDGGTNFNLPDLRGQFLRGFNNGAGIDPDAASRTAPNPGGNTGDAVGSYQIDEFKSHNHPLNVWSSDGGNGNTVDNMQAATSTENTQIGFRGGNETRPKNAYVLFMIKY